MKPSYNDLLEIIEEQRQTIARLEKRVAELEERLKLNSKNSSKPPSTDKKKNKKSPRGGAKFGHKGAHRKLVEHVDKTIKVSVDSCERCGSQELDKRSAWITQQIELPEIKPIVTQIERERAKCRSCGKRQRAPLPQGYENTSFGPKLVSVIGMCSSAYRMSKRTIQEMRKSLLKIDISLGSIPAMERKISNSLSPSYKTLEERINQCKIAYVDETSFRQNAKTHYVWTATTEKESLIKILPTRSIASLEQIRPRGHPGITITDRYQVYAYDKHQYCLAHIQRDLKKYAERDGPDQEIGKKALFEMREIFIAEKHPDRQTMKQRVGYRKKRLKQILYDALANGTDSFSTYAGRLLDSYEKLFLFTKYEGVESTNNAAERTLRHIVLWRKTSYGTQSHEGSRFMERAVTLWVTLKKQGREVLPFFHQAYLATIDARQPAPAI